MTDYIAGTIRDQPDAAQRIGMCELGRLAAVRDLLRQSEGTEDVLDRPVGDDLLSARFAKKLRESMVIRR